MRTFKKIGKERLLFHMVTNGKPIDNKIQKHSHLITQEVLCTEVQ